MYTFDHTPVPPAPFNIVEHRQKSWEQGYYRYQSEHERYDRSGTEYPDRDIQSVPLETTARVASCEHCGIDAQQSKVGQGWLCHGCQTRAELARDTYLELAAKRVIFGTYLDARRRAGRLR